jgi:deoxyadenosine/deoxycytidine kinase
MAKQSPRNARKHKFITIIGNIGVGKSTLTDLLAKNLPAHEIPADSLFKISPFFPLTVNDRARWSLTSDVWFLYQRVKMTQDVPQAVKKNNVVVDSGIPMSFAYAHSRLDSGYFTKEEWQLYKDLHDELLTDSLFPDIVVYLKAPVKFLLERINERGREFELKYYTAEYLRRLSRSLGVVVKKLKEKKVKVITIDVRSKDFVNDPVDLKAILRRLK